MNKIAYTLVLIGSLNWGLYGINRDFNLVNAIFGPVSWLERLVYVIIGLAALWLLVYKMKENKNIV